MKSLLPAALLLLAASAFAQTSPRAAARFLDQATFGPTPAAVAALENSTITDWLNAQFALNTSDLPDQPILDSTGKFVTNLAPIQAAFFQNAVSGQDQLRQRVALALSEIWVVSQTSGVQPAYAFPPYWRIFRDNAFGNYRDIIQAVSLSPAMGRYLNMANNNKASTAHNSAANENYARELMQLFTLGLTQLNLDGTPWLDANNNPRPTYNQAIITQVAKVLTGWTFPTAPGATPKTNNPEYYFGQMFPVEAEHDTTSKAIFEDIVIPAGGAANTDLNSLIDALMSQRTLAPFVSQQLIQHLVTSNPSPAYVERVAQVFQNDSKGQRGDLKAVITAILTDPEARAADDPGAAPDPNFGHLREPFLFMTNLLRGLNGTVGSANHIDSYAANMGQDLFRAPSVFSYFSPQFRTEKGLLGPEFQIYSTQTVANRADTVNTILYGHLDPTTTVDLTPFVSQAGSTSGLLNYIASVFLHGSMSSGLTQAATSAVNAQSTPLAKAQAALYVVLTSGEYNVIM